MKITFSKEICIVSLVTIICSSCNNGSIQTYIRANAVPINKIDVESAEYSDLFAIKKAIGNARIVMLGEQDHGDAPTFLAKTRLIKYLHERMGFNVLAFESDFFGLTTGWENAKKSKSETFKFLRRNVFKVWTYCDACRYLFQSYIPDNQIGDQTIEITGFDSQLVLDYSKANLASMIDSLLSVNKIPFCKTERYKKFIAQNLAFLLSRYDTRDSSKDFYTNMRTDLLEIQNELSGKLDKNNYWMLIIKNLIQLNNQFQFRDKLDLSTVRDRQMAENLTWLLNNKYRNKKVIIWSHNVHIMKNRNLLSDDKYRSPNMCSFLFQNEELEKQTYILGFTSGIGSAGRIGMTPYELSVGETKSLNDVLLKMNFPFSFLDFRKLNVEDSNIKRSFLMKAPGHSYAKEQWNNHFDGIFFVRNMYPCKPYLN